VPAPKAIYEQAAAAGKSSGLDELARAVASGGISGGAVASHGEQERAPKVPRSSNIVVVGLLVGAGLVVVVMLGLVLWLALRQGAAPAAGGQGRWQPSGSSGALPAITPVPSVAFCGIPLNGMRVVYVLDRGNSTAAYFEDLKAACSRSIASLGTDKSFAVVFWNNGSDAFWPVGGLVQATPENLETCRKAMEEVLPGSQSEAGSALQRAVSLNPDVMVLATGKNFLDEDFVGQVMSIRGTREFAIHTIGLDSSSSRAMKSTAEKTGGGFRELSSGELHDYATR
jgi:hypothetical protein